MNDLKDYRNNELKSYVIGNILIVLLLSGLLDELLGKELNDIIDIISLVTQSVILSSIIYIYVLLFDSIIPGNYKFKMTYCFFGSMPGYTIFSDMKKKLKDDRFTKQDVINKYKEIYDNMPIDKKEKKIYENAQWYKIYHKYQNESKIYIANRDFLLCRDITIATILLIVVYLIGACALHVIGFSSTIINILLVELVLSDIAMRGKASRLTYNVISEDIYKNN